MLVIVAALCCSLAGVEPQEFLGKTITDVRIEIAGGLAGHERVIVHGHEGLYAGARVTDVARASGGSAPGNAAGEPAPAAKEKGGSHAGH